MPRIGGLDLKVSGLRFWIIFDRAVILQRAPRQAWATAWQRFCQCFFFEPSCLLTRGIQTTGFGVWRFRGFLCSEATLVSLSSLAVLETVTVGALVLRNGPGDVLYYTYKKD